MTTLRNEQNGYVVRATMVAGILLAAGSGTARSEDHRQPLNAEQKRQVCDRIIALRRGIENLFVQYILYEYGEDHRPAKYKRAEWAASGQKRYRKESWWAPVGEELSRWGTAVWDGQYLKAYDSALDNGSIRAEHDVLNPEHPRTYTEYTQMLGHWLYGTLGELLEHANLEDWQLVWDEPGKTVVLRTRKPGGHESCFHRWTVDLTRGALITQYDIEPTPEGGGVDLTIRNTRAEQVAKGVWLPMEAEFCAQFTEPSGQHVQVYRRLVVETLRINDPTIERYFEFEFPEGSMYYDHILKSSIVVRRDVPTERRKELLDHELEVLTDIYEQPPSSGQTSEAGSQGGARPAVALRGKDGPVVAQEPWLTKWTFWTICVLLVAAVTVMALWAGYRRRGVSGHIREEQK